MAINANGDPARLAEFGLPVLADSLPTIPARWRGCWRGWTGPRASGQMPS
jgi:molybdenum cofactor guanylyltransferase